jgi:hypothetical protein
MMKQPVADDRSHSLLDRIVDLAGASAVCAFFFVLGAALGLGCSIQLVADFVDQHYTCEAKQ